MREKKREWEKKENDERCVSCFEIPIKLCVREISKINDFDVFELYFS